MRALAGDDAGGRGLGQPGLAEALRYAAASLQAAGTEAGYVLPGGKATYLQPVPLRWSRYGTGNRAHIVRKTGTDTLMHGGGMVLLMPGKGVRRLKPATPVFVGYGVSEPNRGWDDYADVDVRGRLVFILEGGFSNLPTQLRPEYESPDIGYQKILAAAVEHGVAGVIAVPPEEAFAHWSILATMRASGTFAPEHPGSVSPQDEVPFPVLTFQRHIFDALFRGTGYDPVGRAGEYRGFALSDVEISLELSAEQLRLTSHNAVGLVLGNDPSAAGELVVVSAHIDHLGAVNGEIYNGANDDASGSAVVLELARRLSARPTRRSVLFVLFTAEEVGHFGSLRLLDEREAWGRQIVSSLNFEHMGRSQDGTFMATASDTHFDLTRAVAGASPRQRLRVRRLEAGGGSIRGSDSYSFYLHDIPLVIVGGGSFPEYHSPQDDVELIDFDLLEDAVAVGEALVRALGGERQTSAHD